MSCRPLALWLLLPVLPCLAEPPPTSGLEPETLTNVVFVTSGPSLGTAFLLRHGDARYLVTARHVVAPSLDDSGVPLTFQVGGRRGRAIRDLALVAQDARADVAVFAYEEDEANPYFPVEAGLVPEDEVRLASPVFLIGYPASLRQTYGSSQLRVVGGWVAGLSKHVPGSTVEYVDIDMPGVEHGHSGGPIVRLQDRVVAVAVQRRTGSISRTIGATYAVPIKYVTALIDGAAVDEDPTVLDELLRDTALVSGVSVQDKSDVDVWLQRIHRGTGEPVWGEVGVSVASSVLPERAYLTVPSLADSTLIVYTIEQPDGSDADVLAQRVSRYGELLLGGGAAGVSVAGTPQPERAPAAIADGVGGAVVAWEARLEGGDVDVRAQRIDADGRPLWGEAGVAVGSATVPETCPCVVDGAGGVALVLFERRLPGGDVDVLAQRVGPDGRLAWHEGKRSVEVAAAKHVEERPRAVSDGAGGAIVVYEAVLATGVRVPVAQRVGYHGELSWGGGLGVLLSPLGMPDGPASVALIPDGFGGAFVAIEVVTDPAKPGDVDIAVQRITPDGRLQWGQDDASGDRLPLLAASSPFPEREPSLVADGTGGLVVAFVSGSENGDLDVWAQRVAEEGVLVWNEGRRSAEVALTFLSEHTVRILDRHQDQVLLVFEIERETGLRTVASQALDLETGSARFGGGKVPLLVVDPDDTDVGFYLVPPAR